jgi:hypothetical protein
MANSKIARPNQTHETSEPSFIIAIVPDAPKAPARNKGVTFRSDSRRHCEPTGPARSGRPDDRLREAIHIGRKAMDCFVVLRAPRNDDSDQP